MNLSIHHIAIICSNIDRSKHFYRDVLGFTIIAENFREEKNSWKIDIAIDEHTQIELFSFPNAPERVTNPEARGLRHIAFRTRDLNGSLRHLQSLGFETEPIRIDEYTGKRFTFLRDPDNLPIELYESE